MNSEPSRVDRPTDDALWRCVSDTLQTVILPGLRPGFERDSARQEHGDDEQRQPWPDDRDLSPKVHGDLTLVASGPGRSTSGSAAAGDPKA